MCGPCRHRAVCRCRQASLACHTILYDVNMMLERSQGDVKLFATSSSHPPPCWASAVWLTSHSPSEQTEVEALAESVEQLEGESRLLRLGSQAEKQQGWGGGCRPSIAAGAAQIRGPPARPRAWPPATAVDDDLGSLDFGKKKKKGKKKEAAVEAAEGEGGEGGEGAAPAEEEEADDLNLDLTLVRLQRAFRLVVAMGAQWRSC